jgi:hypothetical protein
MLEYTQREPGRAHHKLRLLVSFRRKLDGKCVAFMPDLLSIASADRHVLRNTTCGHWQSICVGLYPCQKGGSETVSTFLEWMTVYIYCLVLRLPYLFCPPSKHRPKGPGSSGHPAHPLYMTPLPFQLSSLVHTLEHYCDPSTHILWPKRVLDLRR